MNRAIGEFLKKPDTQERLHKMGLASGGTWSPEETQAYIRKGPEHWKALAQEPGIEAQQPLRNAVNSSAGIPS